MAAARKEWRFGVVVGLLCLLWYIEGSTSNVINKLLLGEFPYPMTVAMSALFATGFLSIPIMNYWKIPHHRPVSRSQFVLKFLIPLAIGKIIALSAAFTSIWKVPVSYAHTIKATMPLFAVFCARLILKESQTWPVYLSLIPIMAGVLIASATELSFNLFGLCAALASTFTYALLNVYVKKALQDVGLHHLRLLSVIAQIACVFLLPIWCLHDLVSIWRDWFSENRPSYFHINTIFIVIISGILNFGQNLVTFTLIHKLTALSYAVANAGKRVSVIAVSLLMLRNPVTPLNVVGMVLSICGVFAYNQAKTMQKGKQKVGLPTSFTQNTLSDATLFQRYTTTPDLSQIPEMDEDEDEEGRLTLKVHSRNSSFSKVGHGPDRSSHLRNEARITMPKPNNLNGKDNYLRRNGGRYNWI